MIKVRNKWTKVQSEYSEEKWKNLPERTKKIFEVLSNPEPPKEVKELEAAQQREAEQVNSESTQTEAEKPKTTTTARQKKTK